MAFDFVAIVLMAIIVGVFASGPLAFAADSSNMRTLTPEELVHILSAKSAKPLLFQVGSHMLYAQAHIPGSEYVGAGNTADGLKRLSDRVSKLSKKTSIVLYCGCCPWSHCPNVNPAYEALGKLGFTNVKVLYIANNFGTDWVDKGYPVERGE